MKTATKIKAASKTKPSSRPRAINSRSYGELAIPHLQNLLEINHDAMERIAAQIVKDVRAGKSLFIFAMVKRLHPNSTTSADRALRCETALHRSRPGAPANPPP